MKSNDLKRYTQIIVIIRQKHNEPWKMKFNFLQKLVNPNIYPLTEGCVEVPDPSPRLAGSRCG